jgi:hypothetical protein
MTETAAAYITAPPPPRESGTPIKCRKCGAIIGYASPNGTGGHDFIPATLELRQSGHGQHSFSITHTACGGVKIFCG